MHVYDERNENNLIEINDIGLFQTHLQFAWTWFFIQFRLSVATTKHTHDKKNLVLQIEIPLWQPPRYSWL